MMRRIASVGRQLLCDCVSSLFDPPTDSGSANADPLVRWIEALFTTILSVCHPWSPADSNASSTTEGVGALRYGSIA